MAGDGDPRRAGDRRAGRDAARCSARRRRSPRSRTRAPQLARRFLHAYGPARPRLLAEWAGIARSHADALWERAGDLAEVDLDGRKAWVLAEDAAALADPPRARGARLLPNLDPLAGGRDREVLVPEDRVRKQIWKVLGGPGLVLVDGEVAAVWRSAKKGKRLVVTVEAIGTLSRTAKRAIGEEVPRLAAFRAAETTELTYA